MENNSFFQNNVILENQCVLLRPLQWSDVDNLLHFSINEPDLWKYSLVRANGKENLEDNKWEFGLAFSGFECNLYVVFEVFFSVGTNE